MSARKINDECIVCIEPTDTALASYGESEWHIAFLICLGVPADQAASTLSYSMGTGLGKGPDGRYPLFWHVCESCVDKSKANFPAPVLALPDVDLPCVNQMGAGIS